MTEDFKEAQTRTLNELKERMELINQSIISIEYDLAHPQLPIEIDFRQIEQECEEFNQWLYTCDMCREPLTKDERGRFNNLVEFSSRCDKCKKEVNK